MVKDVMEFQEEAASLSSIPDLQEAVTRAMIGLGLPHFSYAWSHSPLLDRIEMTDDSFFTTITDKFFVPYIESGLYKHDYSIYACRGTTNIPSLIGRTCHRWRNVSRSELSRQELALDDFEKEFFVEGLTSLIENHDKRFFSGVSLIGQGMSMREFDHALANAPKALLLFRIYHDRFHFLRRSNAVIQVHPSELQIIADTIRRGDAEGANTLLAKMIDRSPVAPERSIIVAPKYEIKATVVNVIEHNAAPINIDARAVDVAMTDAGDCRKDKNPQRADDITLADGFEHSADYDRIRLNGERFRFGMIQARIIRQLHEASRTPCPWVPEKQLLSDAGSGSEDLRRAFKNHDRDALFETDTIGRVRLRL